MPGQSIPRLLVNKHLQSCGEKRAVLCQPSISSRGCPARFLCGATDKALFPSARSVLYSSMEERDVSSKHSTSLCALSDENGPMGRAGVQEYGVGSRRLVVAPTRPIGLTLLVLDDSVG